MLQSGKLRSGFSPSWQSLLQIYQTSGAENAMKMQNLASSELKFRTAVSIAKLVSLPSNLAAAVNNRRRKSTLSRGFLQVVVGMQVRLHSVFAPCNPATHRQSSSFAGREQMRIQCDTQTQVPKLSVGGSSSRRRRRWRNLSSYPCSQSKRNDGKMEKTTATTSPVGA